MEGESFNRNPAHAATSAKASVPAPNASTSRLIAQPAGDWICRAQLARNWPVIFNSGAGRLLIRWQHFFRRPMSADLLPRRRGAIT